MSLKTGFFNSVNGDRVYNADDLNHFFEGIISDGVFRGYGKELEVTASGGMSVRVLTGKAICLNKYIENTSALDVTIEGGNSLPRIDAVVVNTNLQDRTGYIYVKQGTPASNPIPPTLYDNANTKEMALAYVSVPANSSAIVASNITDKRNDVNVCGWVKLTNTAGVTNTYRNNITAAQQVSDINIGIDQYVADTDALFVYKNGLLLEEVNEYLVQGTGSTAKIHLKNNAQTGSRFSFVVLHIGL